MKKGRPEAGYTIVETMIFLAVSGALFVSAMLLVNGQQQKAQFSQGVRDIDSRMQDIINNVDTGYYTDAGFSNNFYCNAIGSSYPTFAPSYGGSKQGTNTTCIFVGQVVQFSVKDNSGNTHPENFDTFTLAGRHYIFDTNPPQETQSIYDAHPTPIACGNTHNNCPLYPYGWDDIEKATLGGGLSVKEMYYCTFAAGCPDPSQRHYIGAVGFLTTFAGYNSIGATTGSTSTNVLPITTSTLNMTNLETADAINNYLNPPSFVAHTDPAELNPPGGVTICFISGGTQQTALLKIGGNSGAITTSVTINSGVTCP